AYDNNRYINDWIKPFRADKKDITIIGKFPFKGNDFQNQNMIQIVHNMMPYNTEAGQFLINSSNLIKAAIYFAVRKCIKATWLNDRDQFLHPNKKWQKDKPFQNDCLTFALFNNNIQIKYGINHWIPFTEYEVNAPDKFASHFMSQFIQGKLKSSGNGNVFGKEKIHTEPLEFSAQAQAVFNAGRELWKYYLAKPDCNVNAALYDIKEYFQGRNEKGKMNNKSEDEQYTILMNALKYSLKELSKKIEPKVYEYGFLMQ
ncbi:MAG: hypothetical protein RL637_1493, partial [Pseudomonadota bacterium]